MGDVIGYTHAATHQADTAADQQALRDADCVRVFTDVPSRPPGDHRPELARVLTHLRAGDTLVVCRLDDLAHSLAHLLATIHDLHSRGVSVRSLHERLDTTSPPTLHALTALATFQRDLARERTQAGLTAARANGRTGGRPPALTDQQVALARRMHTAGSQVATIATTLGVSRATIYRRLQTTPE